MGSKRILNLTNVRITLTGEGRTWRKSNSTQNSNLGTLARGKRGITLKGVGRHALCCDTCEHVSHPSAPSLDAMGTPGMLLLLLSSCETEMWLNSPDLYVTLKPLTRALDVSVIIKRREKFYRKRENTAEAE